MPKEKEDTGEFLLRSRLEASLQRISFLEMENEQLRRENALLRAQDADRRSTSRKKSQAFVGSIRSSQEKQMYQTGTDDGLQCENSISRSEFFGTSAAAGTRSPRVPNPPPSPKSSSPTTKTSKETGLPPPPPPPPLPLSSSRSSCRSVKAVRRVPEVLELYRSLTRKEGKSDTRAGSLGVPAATSAREMIGEIENRSAYLLAVENAAHGDISQVEAFVKWLDEELSYLVDERAVLKHFPKWPEQKADAMREAAVGYRELKNLEGELFSFRDDKRQPTSIALKRMQALQDNTCLSLRGTKQILGEEDDLHAWIRTCLLQLKVGSMKLAKEYMNRVVTAVKLDAFSDDEEVMLQGVRFAYRVHQVTLFSWDSSSSPR
ncbi:hypothetical protein B296_00017670 [Ensete ventricosum]|uniref:Protein CHUP1, chloroplastic n=1 Tax=Ensete ventricosum TaxID=4639 RepID=A0A426ZDU4_ENSVE|nr:hypothetical protein B296_00017670 [Ensete ventricosum]